MGRLVAVILGIFGLWMGLWAVGSIAYERGLNSWIEQRRAEGWVADVGALNVAGFPSRFDTTLTDIHLADPATGIAWSAPFVQFLSLAYKPHQVIVVFPDQQVFSTPLQNLNISTDQARGSLYLEASTALGLDRSTVVIDGLSVASTLGWDLAVAEGRFAVEKMAAAEASYRLGVELTELRPSAGARATLDPAGILPERVEIMRFDATVEFTDQWDRRAIEVARPQITAIDLKDLSARWGDVTFRAAGELTVDDAGIPEGRITVKAVEWRRLLDMAVSTGLFGQTFAPAFERALELLAGLNGPPDTLDAPLSFQNGFVSFGPIPLGPAPRLVLR